MTMFFVSSLFPYTSPVLLFYFLFYFRLVVVLFLPCCCCAVLLGWGGLIIIWRVTRNQSNWSASRKEWIRSIRTWKRPKRIWRILAISVAYAHAVTSRCHRPNACRVHSSVRPPCLPAYLTACLLETALKSCGLVVSVPWQCDWKQSLLVAVHAVYTCLSHAKLYWHHTVTPRYLIAHDCTPHAMNTCHTKVPHCSLYCAMHTTI